MKISWAKTQATLTEWFIPYLRISLNQSFNVLFLWHSDYLTTIAEFSPLLVKITNNIRRCTGNRNTTHSLSAQSIHVFCWLLWLQKILVPSTFTDTTNIPPYSQNSKGYGNIIFIIVNTKFHTLNYEFLLQPRGGPYTSLVFHNFRQMISDFCPLHSLASICACAVLLHNCITD